MFARTTQLEIDTVRVPLAVALARFEDEVMPRLRQQPGFCGVYVLSTPDGRALLLTFWDSADAADAAGTSGWYPDVLAEYTTLFRAPPGRERYEVRLAVPPVMTAATGR